MGRSRVNARLGMKTDYHLEDAEIRSRRPGLDLQLDLARAWDWLGIVRPRGQVYRLEKL
jgi:hypothetical protein